MLTTKEILQLWQEAGLYGTLQHAPDALAICIWRRYNRNVLRDAMRAAVRNLQNMRINKGDTLTIAVCRYVSGCCKTYVQQQADVAQEIREFEMENTNANISI